MKSRTERYTLFFFIVLSTTAYSQLHVEGFERIKKESHLEEVIWKDGLTYQDFDLAKAKTYTDEDAVVLDKRSYYSQKIAKVGACMRRQLVRQAIFIRTNKGVEEFSTFELGRETGFDKYANVGIRIFKPDGRVVEIPEVEFEINDEWKLAVPDLQVNDILESYLFVAKAEAYSMLNSSKVTNYFLASNYVRLHQYLEFTLEKETHLKYRLMNGAPEPQVFLDMEDYNGSKLVFDINEVSPKVDDDWAYEPMLSEPCISFRFYFGRMSSAFWARHHLTVERPFSDASNDEMDLALIYNLSLPHFYGTSRATDHRLKKKVLKEMKSLTYTSKRERMVDFYRRATHKKNGGSANGSYQYDLGDVLMATMMLAKDEGVRVDWVYVRPGEFGLMKDLMNYAELREILRLTFDDGSQLFFEADEPGSPIGMNMSSLDGAEAFLRDGRDAEDWELELIRMPTASSAENIRRLDLDMKLDDGLLKGQVIQTSSGHFNNGMQLSLEKADIDNADIESWFRLWKVLAMEENVELLGYPGESKLDYQELIHPVRNENAGRSDFADDLEELASDHSAFLLRNGKLNIERMLDVEIDELDSLHLISTGRLNPEDDFSFSTHIRVDDQVQDLGEDRLIKLSWLLQTLSEDDREREGNVDFPYLFQDQLSLRIAVADGYIVQGVEELEKEIVNDFGRFHSTAEVSEGELMITYGLEVNQKHVDLADWDQVLAVYDVVHDFSQAKLLFKKQ